MNENIVGNGQYETQAKAARAASADQCTGTSEPPNAAAVAPQGACWANIPAALRERSQWVLAGADKRPLTADGRAASVIDPSTWTDFDTACRAAKAKGLYIGFVETADDPFTCIDLDVKDDTPKEHIERFHKIVEAADSYTEWSCSGKGMHIWVEGTIGAGVRRDGVEIYSQERFIICTGHVYINKPLNDNQSLLDTLVEQMRGRQRTAEPLPDGPEVESDEIILNRARSAANSEKFNAHFNGDWNAIKHTDHSTADAALIGMLAIYTQNNAQLKRLFLASKLGQRDKATKRRDYVDRTISAVRGWEASGPSVEHGREQAFNIISFELSKRLRPQLVAANTGRKLRLVSEDEMAGRPPLRWRVRDVLPEEGFVAVYGAPGSGKSFLVLDMLGAISTGREWFDHKVRPAPVVYVALEGKAGVAQRVRAYHAKYGRLNTMFIDEQIDLRQPEDRARLVNAIRDAGWINGVLCIDTLAASAPGMDENTSTDMGALIAGLQEIQATLGGCVLVVHHTGKDQTRGLRGWSGLTGALDGAIEVSRTESSRMWGVTKAKDGEDGKVVTFELQVVVLDIDEDGVPITSCVVVSGKPDSTTEEVTEQVLSLIREYYDRGEYISTAHNSPNSAYKLLKDDPKFPKTLNSKELANLLRHAERDGLLDRETYKDTYRNERHRWNVI